MNDQKTELPVTLFTGYQNGNDPRREAVQRIEKAALYIQSIFNLIKISAERLEDSENYQIQELGGDFAHLSEIGYGVADSLLASVMPLSVSEPAQTAEAAQTAEINSLAQDISALLNRADLPPTIYKGLRDGILNVFNDEADQSEIIEFQNSPEYLEMILRGLEASDEK